MHAAASIVVKKYCVDRTLRDPGRTLNYDHIAVWATTIPRVRLDHWAMAEASAN